MSELRPSKKEFRERARNGAILPLYAQLDLPRLTPLQALEAFRSDRCPVLLESARTNGRTGRYSFVTCDPYLIFRSRNGEVELSLPSVPPGRYGSRATLRRKPLLKLRELMANYRTERVAGLPPFTGGAVGFLGYEFARGFESLPCTARNDLNIPDAYFIFVDFVVAFDHILDRAWVIVNPGAREQELGYRRPDPGDGDRLYDDA